MRHLDAGHEARGVRLAVEPGEQQVVAGRGEEAPRRVGPRRAVEQRGGGEDRLLSSPG
jgi:hypothetical protein